MIQEGLKALLAANAGVSALVAGRIFPVLGPPDIGQMPYVVYVCVGGSSEPSLSTSGVLRQRIEINAHAETYGAAAVLRAAIISAVNGWNETLADGTHVLNTTLLNPGTDFCGEDRIFRCMVEFYVLYTLPA